MAVRHDHWRNLGRGPSITAPDKSTGAILARLKAPRDPKPITAHAGVASVNASGAQPTQPKLDGGNTEANAKFNQAAKGPNYRPNTVMVTGE